MSDNFTEIKKRFRIMRKPYEETEDVTVTQLSHAHAPVLLFEDKAYEAPIEIEEASEEAATPRNEFGSIFHKVMEFMMKQRHRKSFSAAWFKKITADLSIAEQTEIRKTSLQFWRGPWGRAIRECKKCYPELPFIYKTRYGVMKGQIDLVYQGKDGGWVILDYKTNRVERELVVQASEEYRWQLAFYALAFKNLYGEAPKKAVLYFSSPDAAHEFQYSESDFFKFEEELEAAYRTVLK